MSYAKESGYSQRATKKFTRVKEDFYCEVCGALVVGNGYTNHCHNCLYSKHVDINPGDRQSLCKGIMKPIAKGYNKKKGIFIIHECIKCKTRKNNKISKNDREELIDNLSYE